MRIARRWTADAEAIRQLIALTPEQPVVGLFTRRHPKGWTARPKPEQSEPPAVPVGSHE